MQGWRRSLAVLSLLLWPDSAAAIDEEIYKKMPPGEAKELVYDHCNACHSMKLVVQQGLSRDGWADVLDYMYEEQGMLELSAEERRRILDYLAIWYGEDRAAAEAKSRRRPP